MIKICLDPGRLKGGSIVRRDEIICEIGFWMDC